MPRVPGALDAGFEGGTLREVHGLAVSLDVQAVWCKHTGGLDGLLCVPLLV